MTDIAPATTARVYEIPASLEPDARDKVAKVNRRLAKLNLPQYQLAVTAAPSRPVYAADGTTVVEWHAYVAVTVTGDIPRLADWQPVATLTRDDPDSGTGAGVITRVWPGLTTEPDLRQFRGRESATAR